MRSVSSQASARRRRGARAERWGRAAEDAAAAWYEARGGRVVARRARTAAGEIDLVIACGRVTVFAEVKARRSLEQALEAGAKADWPRRAAAAEAYAAQTATTGDLRLDLCAIDGGGRLEVVENVGVAALH